MPVSAGRVALYRVTPRPKEALVSDMRGPVGSSLPWTTRVGAAVVVLSFGLAGCSQPTSTTASPPDGEAAGAAAPVDAGAPTPPLRDACPSVETVRGWAGGDWLEDSIQDGIDRAAECDYFSEPYDPASPSLLEGRYVIMLSTWDTPADQQLDRVRADARAAGGEVAEVEVGSFPGLRFVDAEGLSCQLIARTSESSTALVVVADPADEMKDDCEVTERILVGLLAEG
jgi:hypothetical protein